jgi:hypothetical protein
MPAYTYSIEELEILCSMYRTCVPKGAAWFNSDGYVLKLPAALYNDLLDDIKIYTMFNCTRIGEMTEAVIVLNNFLQRNKLFDLRYKTKGVHITC